MSTTTPADYHGVEFDSDGLAVLGRGDSRRAPAYRSGSARRRSGRSTALRSNGGKRRRSPAGIRRRLRERAC